MSCVSAFSAATGMQPKTSTIELCLLSESKAMASEFSHEINLPLQDPKSTYHSLANRDSLWHTGRPGELTMPSKISR